MDSPHQCAVVEVADLTGDYLNVCLLLVLYTLQARTKHHPWKGKFLVFKGMHMDDVYHQYTSWKILQSFATLGETNIAMEICHLYSGCIFQPAMLPETRGKVDSGDTAIRVKKI